MKSIFNNPRLAEICKLNQVAYLGGFGSYARNESTARSDVDLLVRFSRRKSLLDIIRLQREFAEVLGKKVDLLTEAAISPYLRERIKAEVKVLYEKKMKLNDQ